MAALKHDWCSQGANCSILFPENNKLTEQQISKLVLAFIKISCGSQLPIETMTSEQSSWRQQSPLIVLIFMILDFTLYNISQWILNYGNDNILKKFQLARH